MLAWALNSSEVFLYSLAAPITETRPCGVKSYTALRRHCVGLDYLVSRTKSAGITAQKEQPLECQQKTLSERKRLVTAAATNETSCAFANRPAVNVENSIKARYPADSDARHVQAGGFEVISTDLLFIFPRAPRLLRGIEPLVSHLPLGDQYQVLCRKPWANSAGAE